MIEIKPRTNAKYPEADFYIDGEIIEQSKLSGHLRLDIVFLHLYLKIPT